MILEVAHEPFLLRRGEDVLRPHQRAHLLASQPPQIEAFRPRLAHEQRQQGVEGVATGQLVRAIGDEQQQGQRGEFASEESQQGETGGIGPMEIVEKGDHRLLLRKMVEEFAHLPEECRLIRRLDRVAGQRIEARRHRASELLVIVVQEIDPRTVGRRLGEVVAAPDQRQRTLVGRLPTERFDQRGLADPGLATDQHEPAAPTARRREQFAQQHPLALSSDEECAIEIPTCGVRHHRLYHLYRRATARQGIGRSRQQQRHIQALI